jgi:hypothetical protein
MVMRCLSSSHVLLGPALTCQLTGFGLMEDVMAEHQYYMEHKVQANHAYHIILEKLY